MTRFFLPTVVAVAVFAAVLAVVAEDEEDGAFEAPTRAQRTAAIGSLDGLDPVLARAFTPGDAFLSIPEPGPYDWLAHFPEPGQTHAEYVASEPNLPKGARTLLYVQPLGAFEAGNAPPLEALRRFAAAFFGLDAKLLPAIPLEKLEAKSRTNRLTKNRQLLSTDILEALKRTLPPDAYCSIGVTMEDLYPDERWNFVFGQASLKERVGVYSFVRYDPAFPGERAVESDRTKRLVLRRSCKVLAHETGHMFGLHHCIHFLCLMNGSNHLQESDSRPLHLCPVCLRKLNHAAGFDVAKRYAALAAFCREAGFADEADWYAAREAHVRGDAR